ncbi:MAG: hypothetical protein SPI36_02350 [Candidatus Onthovivens sp.]|nr:hypothetical protein [Mollicutes bacterium]MDD7546533.1 hypothetical protein [Bacilli bacterium]MDY3761690.1 hypothetical protein [Candidatus Onthovivens sp.]MCI7040202.1 hypothetical protein [Mollicutes bacterium]MCI7224964.1 hypothetical protein [Mollicutes bacterium]
MLFDYIDDEYTDNVLVISVFEYIHFAEDRTELKSIRVESKEKNILIDWN